MSDKQGSKIKSMKSWFSSILAEVASSVQFPDMLAHRLVRAVETRSQSKKRVCHLTDSWQTVPDVTKGLRMPAVSDKMKNQEVGSKKQNRDLTGRPLK